MKKTPFRRVAQKRYNFAPGAANHTFFTHPVQYIFFRFCKALIYLLSDIKYCSKLPECVDILTLQNLNIPGLPDYQIPLSLCRCLKENDLNFI